MNSKVENLLDILWEHSLDVLCATTRQDGLCTHISCDDCPFVSAESLANTIAEVRGKFHD